MYKLLNLDNSFFVTYAIQPNCDVIVTEYPADHDPITAVGGITLMSLYQDYPTSSYPIGNTVGLSWTGFSDCATVTADVPHTYNPLVAAWYNAYYYDPGTLTDPCENGYQGVWYGKNIYTGETYYNPPWMQYKLGSTQWATPICTVYVYDRYGAGEDIGCVIEGWGHRQDVEYTPFEIRELGNVLGAAIPPGATQLLQVH